MDISLDSRADPFEWSGYGVEIQRCHGCKAVSEGGSKVDGPGVLKSLIRPEFAR